MFKLSWRKRVSFEFKTKIIKPGLSKDEKRFLNPVQKSFKNQTDF
jgi:hypothetical protein